MELPQISLDTYVAICLVIATPWLYRTFAPFSTEKSTKTRKEQAIAILILVHTLYMLHGLLVSPPQNIFKALGFGLDVPPEYLRAKLAENFGGEQNVPPHLNTLLKRMGLSDLRSLYVRFGHNVLTTCSYCQSYDDFALYAFPAPLLEYIREIAFVGLLTLPKSSTAHFRPLGLGALLAALMTEAYWTLTTPIIIPNISSPNHNVTMWHDTFVQFRHTLFLLLPLITSILPSLGLHRVPVLGAFIPSPEAQHANLPPAQFQMQGQNPAIPANATLSQTSSMTMQTLQHLVPTLHLLKYTHAAVMRSQSDSPGSASDSKDASSIHARATEWWAEEAREGEIVRTDEGVLKILKSAGLSMDEEIKDGNAVIQPEGQLLLSAKMAVNFLKEQGSKPSEHWVYAAS